ncbi:MAG TPA: hypothetical protein VFJ82_11895 [Longimicrobium sp.]|nr:hypothetical protein [Longimicrobium sp.]
MRNAIWTAEAQRQRDHRWAGVLGALSLVGTWSFVRVPAPLLRGHWDSSLAWMVVLACCGSVATASWNGRLYGRVAGKVMIWAVVIAWALVLTAAPPFSVPGVSLPVLVAISVLLAPLHLYLSEQL